MALDPENQAINAGRITAASPAYPYGSSKEETVPGLGDGTPYAVDRANDIYGEQQSLLSDQGVIPNNTPDSLSNPQYLQAKRLLVARGHETGFDFHLDPGDIAHDLTVNPGTTVAATKDITIALDTAITKQIDAVWAAGDNAGGLPAGAVTTGDYINVFAILDLDPITGVKIVDVGFDSDPAAANLMAASGYTHYKEIGRAPLQTSTFSEFSYDGDGWYRRLNIWPLFPGIPLSSTSSQSAANFVVNTELAGAQVRLGIDLFAFLPTAGAGIVRIQVLGTEFVHSGNVAWAAHGIVDLFTSTVYSTVVDEFRLDAVGELQLAATVIVSGGTNSGGVSMGLLGWKVDRS